MKLLKSLRYTFKNNLRFRTFVLFSAVIIFMSCVLLLLFLRHQFKAFEELQVSENANQLTQFKIFSDESVLSGIYSLTHEDIFYDFNNSDIRLLWDDDSYLHQFNDYNDKLDMISLLQAFHANKPYIYSMDIYNRTNDTFISSKSGAFYNVFQKGNTYSDLIPFTCLEYSFLQPYNHFFIPPDVTRTFYKSKTIISMVQTIPSFCRPKDCNLFLITNIDAQVVYQSFLNGINTERENYQILDSNLEVLFNTDQQALMDQEERNLLPSSVFESEQGHTFVREKGGISLISWSSSNQSNWKYVYTSTNSNYWSLFYPTIGSALAICLFILLTCFAAIFYISKWLYLPLNALVLRSKDKLQDSIIENDVKLICTAFSDLDNEVTKLNMLLLQNDTLILNNIFQELIHNKIDDLNMLNSRLLLLDQSFEESAFYIMILKADEIAYNQLTYQQKEVLHLTVEVVIRQYFEETYRKMLKAGILFNYDGYFTCIVNTSAEQYEHERVEHSSLLEVIGQKFNPIFNMGISPCFDDFSQFRHMVKEVSGYFKYSYIYGNNNVFTKEIILEYEQNSSGFSDQSIHHLKLLLKTHKFKMFKEQVEFLFQQIKVHGYSYIYSYNLFIQLISLINQECIAQNIHDEILNHQNLLNNFSLFHHLEESVPWFYTLIDRFEFCVQSRNNHMEAEMINKIIEYIKEHLDANISLNSVADYFHISTGHLSRYFKEKSGINFSEYVSNAKFEKAALLLLDMPPRKVSDIAAQLGYSNLTYFTKLFKEHFGATPSDYRKIHTLKLKKQSE